MIFYSVKERKKVTIPDKQVKYKTSKNGRKMAVAVYKGSSLYRFI